MKRQACGFLVSLIIHTVVIVLAGVIGTTSALMNTKPVIIDLSILESVINSPGPPKDEKVLLAPKMPEPDKPKPIENPKIVQKIRQLEKKVDECSEPKIVTPVEEQGPVPIASAEVPKTQPLTETLPGTGDQSACGTGLGGGGGLVGGAGNGTGGISADSLRKKYLSEHFAYIKKIIQENITYPARAQRMGWQGKVIIEFIILENGNATTIKIAKSSGFDVLDDNVVKTVEAVAPFPKPPVRAEVRVPIIYRLE
ncbi:MAG: energy transducer TonB [Thermodesulfobacteriota bacterium]|jgi:protein TonB|nr:MAG: energy transducer TonB [Thermodesulfobacteriota bacterium]